MKELRFSIQCGASNRKALIDRRCSQCTVDNTNVELDELSSRSPAGRSLSIGSTQHQTLNKTRSTETDKFDRLLMLASERKNSTNSSTRHRNSPRRDVPLLLVEQDQTTAGRTHQVRFSTNTGK